MNIVGRYKNGNYKVIILDDGTKIRYNDEDKLIPEFPESFDIKINNRCDMGCPMCHEGATKDGANPDIMNASFINSLHPYTELAIGGGNPLEHPDLIEFLKLLKSKKLLPSMTVHQNHFIKNLDLLHHLVDSKLIYGLGVSLVNPGESFINEIQKFPNAVVHVINGLVTINQLRAISNKNLKILVLGYKEFRRGKDLYSNDSENIIKLQNDFYDTLESILLDNWFKVVSFDNLAISQLDVKRFFNDNNWDEFYMGDDGQYTMYIDMVNKTFSTCSTTPIEERHEVLDNIIDMFNVIKKEHA